MNNRTVKKKKITPEEAVQILKKSGLEVTVQEAKNILELLYILAKLEIDHNLKR
ncbi:hypothetical protein ACVW0P_004391 [Mucilaginibacter sp. UYNi724]